MVAFKVPGIQEAVKNARAAGIPATEIIDAMGEGMTEVGILFERGKL
ncbi:MAG: B12-binding domain-containing protein, partial [Candidatus Methanoplasma sp.]|nr:B12-binding domain-containing protein [Candidatus Methanoplasma sp.]